MTATTRTIQTAPGVHLSVRVAGSGPLIILMHGWPELGLSWRHQLEPLAAAGYTVAAPDMRGYGASSQPREVDAYSADAMVDDMNALATALGARRWAAVGHDWGSPIAWRSALRHPDKVVGVFSLSVPHMAAPPGTPSAQFDLLYPDRFFYVRYFQPVGPAEAELERDVRAALKKIFFALSGDAPKGSWVSARPKDDPLLPGLPEPPPGPLSFMSDAELDQYAAHYRRGGFFGSLSWYRNLDRNAAQARAYGEQRIHQPAGFLCGDKEIVIAMGRKGGRDSLEAQRALCADLRVETILPGAGHWIQQERPREVAATLARFFDDIRKEQGDW